MSGEEITVEKPGDFPLAKDTRRVYEPLAATSIVTPQVGFGLKRIEMNEGYQMTYSRAGLYWPIGFATSGP